MVCQRFYNNGYPSKEVLAEQFSHETDECQKTAAFIIRQQSAAKMRALNNKEVAEVFGGLNHKMCHDLMEQQELVDSIAPPAIVLNEDLTEGADTTAP